MNIELLFEVSIYLIYITPYYERDIVKLQKDIIVVFFKIYGYVRHFFG